MKLEQIEVSQPFVEVVFINENAHDSLRKNVEDWAQEHPAMRLVFTVYEYGGRSAALRVGACRSGSPTIYTIFSGWENHFEGSDVIVECSDFEEYEVLDEVSFRSLKPDKTETIDRSRFCIALDRGIAVKMKFHGYKRKIEHVGYIVEGAE